MPERWRIVPKVIQLGTATSEDLSEERRKYYERLVLDVWPSDGDMRAQEDQTIYLSLNELRSSASQVYKQIVDVSNGTDTAEGTVVLVDFTPSPRELIIESVARYAGKAVGSLLLSDADRRVLVLMPAVETGLQQAFRDMVGDHPGWLTLQYGDGDRVRISGGQAESQPIDKADQHLVEELHRLNQPIKDRLGGKILRRLGHYQFGSSDKYCTRYFFDASYAVPEVSQLTRDLIKQEVANSDTPLMIVSHQASSPWLPEVGAEVAQRLRIQHFAMKADKSLAKLPTSGTAVLLLDVVNTGSTAEELVDRLRRHGLTVRPTIVAVFIDRERLGAATDSFRRRIGADIYQFRCAGMPIERRKRGRAGCEQCRLDIPILDPQVERPDIRAYDMWEMLLAHEWVAESYGPGDPDGAAPGPARFSTVPDFEHVFADYGDWIAYKLDRMLEATIGVGTVEELVYVCPEERAMEQLTDRLKARRGARPVAVKIPREMLWAAECDDFSKIDRHPHKGWRRQLGLLAERKSYSVAIIDEFNGSNTTALSMLKILRRLGVEVRAYLPVLNRHPGSALRLPGGPEVPIHPLYEIPSPRPGVGPRDGAGDL